MCTLSVSNVNYHKFSHGATSPTLNWKNVNVMLGYEFYPSENNPKDLDPSGDCFGMKTPCLITEEIQYFLVESTYTNFFPVNS